MEPISKVLGRAMTGAKALTTGTSLSAPTPDSSKISKLFPQFRTFKDPVLEGMEKAASAFSAETYSKSAPRWLSFLGRTGTGKTFLADLLLTVCHPGLSRHPTLANGLRRHYWPTLLEKLRDQKYWLMAEIAEANLVFLDELVLEHDPTGFAKDKLCEILGRRIGKWTIFTSNLDLEQFERIDPRITSRLIRGANTVKICNTTDYSLRR